MCGVGPVFSQPESHQDPEMQLAELREYAGRRGWQILEEFTDQTSQAVWTADVSDHRRHG